MADFNPFFALLKTILHLENNNRKIFIKKNPLKFFFKVSVIACSCLIRKRKICYIVLCKVFLNYNTDNCNLGFYSGFFFFCSIDLTISSLSYFFRTQTITFPTYIFLRHTFVFITFYILVTEIKKCPLTNSNF